LAWGLVLLLASVWFCVDADRGRRAALAEAKDRLETDVEVAAVQVARLTEGADIALRTAAVLVGSHPDWSALGADAGLWQGLHDIVDLLSGVPRIILIDADGFTRLHTDTFGVPPVSLADRDYFRLSRDAPPSGAVIGAPVIGRTSGAPAIPFARRIDGPSGRFLGVAATNLEPGVIQSFFRSLQGRGIVFSLLRGDGTVLVRHPARPNEVGRRVDLVPLFPGFAPGIAKGGAIVASPFDGVERISFFQRLDRYDLIVTAAVPVKDALAPWRQQMERSAGLGAVGALLLTLALALIVRRRAAEIEARRNLAVSEANLSRAQAVAHIGSWQVLLPGWDLVWSAETYRIFGLPVGAPIDLDSVRARMHPEDRARLITLVRAALSDATLDVEFRILAFGRVVWVTVRAQGARGPDGRPTEILGTIQDVSERRRAEEDLRRQAEELARSNTELEQFAYVASHDLREPLRMISSYVELLGRRYGDRLDDDAREFIAFARDGAERMDRLVLDLLDYSRIGRLSQPMRPVLLDGPLDRALRVLALKIDEAGAVIDRLSLATPVVIGDPDELARLFQNLIGNAVKYRDPARPMRITITAERQGTDWAVSIADTGIGIDAEYFDRIFRIFQRLHTRATYEGTGIGLAICKKIVEHHGGRIWVESNPGLGSVFHFTLPAGEPE
jgi:PAS domain S-box-containing protein